MSTRIDIIENSGGKYRATLDITQFYGGDKHGPMLQITQGFGGTGTNDGPGYIQLTKRDAQLLMKALIKWTGKGAIRLILDYIKYSG